MRAFPRKNLLKDIDHRRKQIGTLQKQAAAARDTGFAQLLMLGGADGRPCGRDRPRTRRSVRYFNALREVPEGSALAAP